MRHPLVNPSLAPYSFVFPLGRERLDYEPAAGTINPERFMMKLWDQANRKYARGPRPVETIIHHVMPSLATVNRRFEKDFEFEGLPYRSRDILVLSAIVQWLATNCGDCFLTQMPLVLNPRTRHAFTWTKNSIISLEKLDEFHPEREFLLKLRHEDSSMRYYRKPDMVTLWTHACNEHCHSQTVMLWGHGGHYFDRRSVEPRDRQLANALMHWLGSKDGRAFIADYLARRTRKREAAARRAYPDFCAKLDAMRANRVA